ncbi:mitochondrial ribosomal protein L48 [Carabus blaptoides fortunei]
MQRIYRQIGRLCDGVNKSTLVHRARQYSKLYEPAYLESIKSKIPLYDTLNIQLKGYDYPVLEHYQKFLHNMLKNMDVAVEECWATPAQHSQIVRYKAKSSVIDSEYTLKQYERNIQIVDVSATQLPVVLRVLDTTVPEGVTLSVHEHDDWYEEVRYVPDKELLDLKSQLEDISTPSTKKK